MLLNILLAFLTFACWVYESIVPDFHIFAEFYSSLEEFVASTYRLDGIIPVDTIWQMISLSVTLELILLAVSFSFWILNAIVGTRTHSGDSL